MILRTCTRLFLFSIFSLLFFDSFAQVPFSMVAVEEDLEVYQVTVSAPVSLEGQPVTFFLYQKDPLKAIGFGTHDFAFGSTPNVLTIPVFDLETGKEGVLLEKNATYLLVAGFSSDMAAAPVTLPAMSSEFALIDGNLPGNEIFLGRMDEENPAGWNLRIRSVGKVSAKTPDSFSVFPNPVKDAAQLTIRLERPASGIRINIMDAAGQQVYTWTLENTQEETLQFDMSRLPAGSYLANVHTEAGVETKRFVVQR